MKTQNKNCVLEVIGLTCVRDTNILFENLNFCVESGQVLVVEGKNGSGKTSLLRILTGIRQPDEGKVTWNSKDIMELATGYRQDMAYIGHQDGIKQELTAFENLQLTPIYRKFSEKSLEKVLNVTGLDQYADLKAFNLSAGQRRRLAISRLLLTDCSLWILDEPLTTLDKPGINLFEKLLTEHISKGGIAVLSSHHDINLEGGHIIRMSL